MRVGGYADYHEALELDEEEEIMVARFTFTFTDVQDDAKVDIGDRDVSMFSLVSEAGTGYDYIQQRSYIDGNLYENAEEGATQTGALFYIVDKEDKTPAIVFLPSVREGIWFKSVIVDKADDSPMMYYQSLDDKMLYFKLDKAYDIPDEFASYQPSSIFTENPIRDAKQKKGG